MKLKHAVLLIGIVIISGCKKQETTAYEPISSTDIASALGMHKFQVKIPEASPSESDLWIELVLVEGDKETPLGFKVGLGPDTLPDVVDIILWPSDDPQMFHIEMGCGKSEIRNEIFSSQTTPSFCFFGGEILQIGDFIFKGGDGGITSTQDLQPNEYGVKTRLTKK